MITAFAGRPHLRHYDDRMGFGKRLTVVACIAFALAGCTTGLGAKPAAPSAVEPTFTLDGVYDIVQDGTGTRNGAPIDDLEKGETKWAFRTSCDAKGCVATGGPIDPNNPAAALPPIRVADYVDGKWSLVFLNQGAACPRGDGQTFQSDQWIIWSVERDAEQKLSIKVTVAGADECNSVTEFSSTLTRIGDLPAGTTLPNPADAPTFVPSYPANSFRGKYTVDYTREDGQSQDSEHMDVKTYCLRSEERCVTTTINVDPHDPGTPYSLQVYDFADDKYQFKQTIGTQPCKDGTEGLASKAVSLPLPPAPVPDPLPTLGGNMGMSFTGECTASAAYNVTFTRTGD
jgi:hypothetical protein